MTTATPTQTPVVPKPTTINVTLPAGMTAEQYQKLLHSFAKSRAYGKVYDLAVRNSMTKLREAHKDEYEQHLTAEFKAAGITRKNGAKA